MHRNPSQTTYPDVVQGMLPFQPGENPFNGCPLPVDGFPFRQRHLGSISAAPKGLDGITFRASPSLANEGIKQLGIVNAGEQMLQFCQIGRLFWSINGSTIDVRHWEANPSCWLGGVSADYTCASAFFYELFNSTIVLNLQLKSKSFRHVFWSNFVAIQAQRCQICYYIHGSMERLGYDPRNTVLKTVALPIKLAPHVPESWEGDLNPHGAKRQRGNSTLRLPIPPSQGMRSGQRLLGGYLAFRSLPTFLYVPIESSVDPS